ncbi:MAG: hypothetical protein R2845_00825 [Thermomicrobiales bacterium]
MTDHLSFGYDVFRLSNASPPEHSPECDDNEDGNFCEPNDLYEDVAADDFVDVEAVKDAEEEREVGERMQPPHHFQRFDRE